MGGDRFSDGEVIWRGAGRGWIYRTGGFQRGEGGEILLGGGAGG